MLSTLSQVLVLWGPHFEEAVTVALVVAFRQLGYPVALVGVGGRPRRGGHGLSLQPDIYLTDALALAPRTGFLVLPCTSANFSDLARDLLIQELLHSVWQNHARLIVIDPKVAQLVGAPPGQVQLFPGLWEATAFVNGL